MPLVTTASSEFLRLLVRTARAEGVPLAGVWAEAGIDPDALFEPGRRIPIALARRAWHSLVKRAGNPLLGLAMAGQLELGALDLFDHFVCGSADCGEGFRRLIRFLPLLCDAGEISFRVDGDTACFRHHAPGGVPAVAELFLALITERGRQVYGASFRLKTVTFSHSAQGDLTRYDTVFRAPIRFGQAADELVFHRDLLDMPNQMADPLLDALVAIPAAEALEALIEEGAPVRSRPGVAGAADWTGTSFVAQVRRALLAGLCARDTTLVGLGARLGMSTRSLQRRLGAHGVAHRDLLEQLRIELAERALRGGAGATQRAVARTLGYSNATAFHRALKRWRAETPAAPAQQLAR